MSIETRKTKDGIKKIIAINYLVNKLDEGLIGNLRNQRKNKRKNEKKNEKKRTMGEGYFE